MKLKIKLRNNKECYGCPMKELMAFKYSFAQPYCTYFNVWLKDNQIRTKRCIKENGE